MPNSSFKMITTPTLLVLDSTHKIQKMWIGQLSPEQERDVERVVQGLP